MSPINGLELGLLGAGECFVDEVEVRVDGGANPVSNGGFDAGAHG